MSASGRSGLFGKPEQVGVERGLAELRSGRPVIVTSAAEAAAILPVDGMTDDGLAAFRLMCAPARPHLLITARRARALALAADAQVARHLEVVPAGETACAAIELAKIAQRLPALLVGDAGAAGVRACDPPLMVVAACAVAQSRQEIISSLAVVAEATIPLNGGFPARFVVFRDGIGGTPLAIIVGQPDFAQPVSVRLHSACLTGDVFGSRRC